MMQPLNKYFRRVVLAVVLAVIVPASRAQTPDRLQQVVQPYADAQMFMGSVLVAKNGKIIFSKGYGMADLEWNVPNSSTTRFNIASMTKQFTAASVLLPMFFGLLIAAAALLPAPCASATSDCTEWIKPSGQSSRVLIYRNYPLETKNEHITRAFVFVHGINRDADNHFRTALAAAFLANALEDTIILAPRFASNSSAPGNETGNCRDTLASDEANWICEAQRPDTWRSGGAAIGANKLSSFDFMDEILRRLARKEFFPNLKTIVVAGHSAGGVFVIRYEMMNQVHDKLGIPISYVVANPSSYAYVDGLRPTPNAFGATVSGTAQGNSAATSSNLPPAFVPFADAKNCTGYETWPYGLKGRTGYSSTLTDEQITQQLVARPVTYLLGEADVLPLGVFDTSCPAMAQGPTRLGRGLAYHKYVNEGLHAHHGVIVVPYCSHSQRCMFTSDVALPVIFPKTP